MKKENQTKSSSEIFVSLLENENPALEGRQYPVAQTIPMIDVIYEEHNGAGRERKIRYIKGAKSIFVDEQKGIDEKLVPVPLVMRDGIFAVSTKEVNLLNFLQLCHYNADAPNRMDNREAIFRKVEPAKEAEDFLAEERQYLELQTRVYDMDAVELEALAMILGDYNADQKKTTEVRRDILVYAQNRPDEFAELLDREDSKYKVFAIRALKRGILTYDRATSEICWQDGNTLIGVPAGVKPEDHLTKTLMKNKELFATIRERVEPAVAQNKKDPQPAASEAPPVATGKRVGLKADEDTLELAEKILAEEIVIKRLPGKNLGLATSEKGEKYYDLGKKNAVGLANLLAEDSALKEIIEKQLKHGTVNS